MLLFKWIWVPQIIHTHRFDDYSQVHHVSREARPERLPQDGHRAAGSRQAQLRSGLPRCAPRASLLDALAVRATVDLHLLGCALSLAGVLACLDGYMNIAMEQTEEYVNGQLKAKYGDTFIRGNNGMPRKRALSTPHMHLLCVRLAAAQSCT